MDPSLTGRSGAGALQSAVESAVPYGIVVYRVRAGGKVVWRFTMWSTLVSHVWIGQVNLEAKSKPLPLHTCNTRNILVFL